MYLSIDIGGTFIKYGVLDKQGNIHTKGKVPTPARSIDALYDVISGFVEEASQTYTLEGMAVSAPGAVKESGVIDGACALPYIHGPNVKQDLQKRFNLPVALENDANCAALAEAKAGSAKGLSDVLFVVCGTGIGGAVIKNGQLHKGKNLFGGEFGMMAQYDHTTKRLESFSWLASTGNMVRRASDRLSRELTGTEVFELAESGNADCQEEVSAFYEYLALLLTNLQSVYDPELIVVSGGITERALFGVELDRALESINELRGPLKIRTEFTVARFRNDANLIGAFFNWKEQYEPV